MARVAVNVDHVATLRQARRASEPDPVTAAALAELAGAQGIVVHLREDRRHIQDRDVEVLRQTVKTKLTSPRTDTSLSRMSRSSYVGCSDNLFQPSVTMSGHEVPKAFNQFTENRQVSVGNSRSYLNC